MPNNSTEIFDDIFLQSDKLEVATIITLLTSTLSFIGSGSIVLCVILHRRVCATEIFPIFHLSVANFFSSLFLMVLCCLFLAGHPSYPGPQGPCGYILAVTMSLFICTFLLTLSYALEAFIRLHRRLQSYVSLEGFRTEGINNNCMYLMYFLSWTLPIALGIFLMLVTHFIKDEDDGSLYDIIPKECSLCFPAFVAQRHFCWAQVKEGNLWLLMYKLIFLLPLLFVFIVNMVLYLCIARDYRHVSMRRGLLSYHQRQEEMTLRKKAILYQTAFIICWIPTLILQSLSFYESFVMKDNYWLFILQSLLGPLQGLLNCIIYGWKRSSFRRALTESSQLLSTNRGGAGMSYTL
ncbi:transmembrane protein 116-like [Pomacea canaliculata]|uniref:transmembrane protein 116-like n=1 Tax=Pomacea canaliculata TaxID=400727 RepID=UPI000D734103|nr:transmembrane protein 116-like [Pomacea canaliculata]